MLATQGVGFGIKNYEISFLNENGTPDTQAGSHPFQFVDFFELNSHFKRKESNADSPYIRLPDGVLRNVKIDLPPGFVGDPNAPSQHCTGQQLELQFAVCHCPPESRVGKLNLDWSENASRQRNSRTPSSPWRPYAAWLCSSAPISSCPCCISTMVFSRAAITPCRRR